jgi:uncharacterized damage-inducible protein DinB
MTLDEILDALEDTRENFLDAIDGLSEEQLCEPDVIGNWSVKDILHHLAMWEAEMVKLLWQALQGVRPTTVHFSKQGVDQINAAWHEQGKDRPLARVMEDFIAVRKQTSRRLQAFQERDLTDAQRYPWLRGHALWEWVAEDSFKHEAEHTAQILAWRNRKGYGIGKVEKEET